MWRPAHAGRSRYETSTCAGCARTRAWSGYRASSTGITSRTRYSPMFEEDQISGFNRCRDVCDPRVIAGPIGRLTLTNTHQERSDVVRARAAPEGADEGAVAAATPSSYVRPHCCPPGWTVQKGPCVGEIRSVTEFETPPGATTGPAPRAASLHGWRSCCVRQVGRPHGVAEPRRRDHVALKADVD